MRRAVVVLGLVLFGLVATVAAAAPSPRYAVEPTLSRVAGVETRCFAEWQDASVGGQFSEYDPWDATARRSVWLPPWVCTAIEGSLKAEARTPMTIWRRAFAWHNFAHEVAHHLGYDHGETTVGADCIGERIDFRLMVDAGMTRAYAKRIDAARTVACPA